MPPSGTFTVDFTYLYKVKFFDIYKLFVKSTVIEQEKYYINNIDSNILTKYIKNNNIKYKMIGKYNVPINDIGFNHETVGIIIK